MNLNTILFCKTPGLPSLSVFTNVISLILFNCQHVPAIGQYEKYFPHLIRLSLWYDNEINLITLSNILNQLQRPIKRLEIHCTGILCPHYHSNLVNMGCTQNFTIEYFLIDTGHFSLPSTSRCCYEYRSCFLMTITDLMQKMSNIRHARLIINRYNFEELLDANE